MPIAVTNPTTGEVVETFTPHDAAEVERRIAAAFAAARIQRETSFAERAVWMRQAADLLDADVEALAHTITLEIGRPLAQSRAEVRKCARACRFFAEHAEEFLRPEPLADPGAVNARQAGIRYDPLGVVLAVMPWNFPLWQVIRFAAPALMAGNTGLLKHASNVPRSALYLDTLFTRAGFGEGTFSTLLIPSDRVETVMRDPRVRAATLTGSEPAGSALAATAGELIKPVVLELGGSDPFVVMPTADIERAAEVAVSARTQNGGQSCIAAKRFIVHTDVYDQFLTLFTERVRALTVGDPLDDATDIGPLATQQGCEDLRELVDDAARNGATVVSGTAPETGWFFAPTVVTDITPEMRLFHEEAFGPVASIYRVDARDEAIALANATQFGLSSSVWSNDDAEIAECVAGIEAGGVFVNGMTVSSPELPFGGIKNSGIGRELAAVGCRAFTNVKTVWHARD